MNKVILSALIILLTACSSGGGDSGGTTAPSSVPSGIYEGTITPTGGIAETAVALITSNSNAAIYRH